ncbi:MAG: NepR family anti-sigma factor [Microvirga sp.]
MTSDTGKKPARVVPEASLSAQLSPEPRLDSVSQGRIGDQLRAMYDDLMQQPVPDRFKDLLEQLDKTNTSRGGEPPR